MTTCSIMVRFILGRTINLLIIICTEGKGNFLMVELSLMNREFIHRKKQMHCTLDLLEVTWDQEKF